MTRAVRSDLTDGVLRLTLCRPDEYNTITPALRDQMSEALASAEHDPGVSVILLEAEGPAFCAGYDLGLFTGMQGRGEDAGAQGWDSSADLHLIGPYAETWARLHDIPKPTIAAVAGWCVAGGVNLAFNADIIVAAESARFGYPPSRVWGIPEAPWTWVARMGPERARRFMLTGDEFTGREAAEMGVVLECVADADLEEAARSLAERIALVPRNQLEMITRSINHVVAQMYDPPSSRLIGTMFDGVARHTDEGRGFVRRAAEVGFREAVRERDEPFGDYGQRR